MTLDEIALDTATKIVHKPEESVKLIAEACLKYARSIIPEEIPPVHYEASQLQEGIVIGKNDLRTQILSRIEEDSK